MFYYLDVNGCTLILVLFEYVIYPLDEDTGAVISSVIVALGMSLKPDVSIVE